MKKTNRQLVEECYRNGGQPVVTQGGNYLFCDLPSFSADGTGGEGYYNAIGDTGQGVYMNATANYKKGDRLGNDCYCGGGIWHSSCCASKSRKFGADGYYNADGKFKDKFGNFLDTLLPSRTVKPQLQQSEAQLNSAIAQALLQNPNANNQRQADKGMSMGTKIAIGVTVVAVLGTVGYLVYKNRK